MPKKSKPKSEQDILRDLIAYLKRELRAGIRVRRQTAAEMQALPTLYGLVALPMTEEDRQEIRDQIEKFQKRIDELDDPHF